jgi:hypothetical protein
VRRYRLAQLDELALASPPYELPEGPGRNGREEPGADETEPQADPPQ